MHRTSLFILTLLATSSALADTSREATQWLGKMTNALRTENYIGTFTYMRGSTFETVRIVHLAEAGRERERLFNLNGEVREVLREDNDIVCYHPKSDRPETTAFAHSPVHIGPFSPFFSERVTSSQNLYRFAMQGVGRIAGHEAVKLTISSGKASGKDGRYEYRLWLDKGTGLLLQSHLVDRGRVKEIFQFTNVDIGSPVTESQVLSSIQGETVSHRLTLDIDDKAEKPAWKVAWLPDGFRPVRMQGNRLHFSNGRVTFSVFVERQNAALLPELTTTVGGTVVITRKRLQSQITVVGEVPVSTARRVAESVEPLSY